MKRTILIFNLFSMFLFSCGTKNVSELTDQEKEVIKSEIAPLMKQIIDNSESGNLDKAIQLYSDSPDFIAISNGQVSDYSKFFEGNKKSFDALESQKFHEAIMNYIFINRETVLITWGGSALTKLRDGQQIKVDPFTASLVFAKANSSWKVIYTHESGVFTPIIIDSTKTE